MKLWLAAVNLFLQPTEALLDLGLGEFVDEFGGSIKPNLPALLAIPSVQMRASSSQGVNLR